MKNIVLFLIIVAIFQQGCTKIKEEGNPRYIQKIKKWHLKREANLKKENGWLNLIGLFWLKEGVNTVGSDPSNDLIFPANRSAKFLGKFIKKDSIIYFVANKGVKVTFEGKPVSKIEMNNDMQNNTTVLAHRSLRWFIIKRGGNRYGVRLRDLKAKLLSEFKGIEYFPINEKWKITAKFLPFTKVKKIEIPTIIGTNEVDFSPGKLIFKIEGKEYSLLPINDGKKLFIIFADKTSGRQTYGAGRFLTVNKPDSTGKVIIDFNKAYNPPCAFTPYATCPLPPKENYLPVKITAGEKKYGNH